MPSELEKRLKVVERLTQLFKFERMVYLSVTILSLLIMLGCALVLLYREGTTIEVLSPLFGSSGLITYSTSKLLRMWDEAIKRIVPISEDKD